MSSHSEYEYIEIDNFDREYTLKDLLSLNGMRKIIPAIQRLFQATFSVHTPEGECYFSDPPISLAMIDLVKTTILHPAKTKNEQEPPKLFLTPIVYELETVGYIAGFPLSIPHHPLQRPDISLVQNLLISIFNQMMTDTHKALMTKGLHGKVVEDSYNSLKKKASDLEKSEEKYRNLAENLEIEVQNKTREIQLAQITLMQQEKLASIGQLSAGIAHEINNPMGFIISNFHTLKSYVSELLKILGLHQNLVLEYTRNSTTSKQFQRLIEDICHAEKEGDIDYIREDIPALFSESLEGAERIRKIVDDLMMFARPDIHHETAIDLNESIDTVIGILSHQIREGITVQKQLSPLPRWNCHPKDIHHMILNILKNAIDAIREEGTIQVTTGIIGGKIQLSIKDNGIGIPKEDLSRIFDPFFTRKKIGEGMGLGLYGVYHTVNRYHGDIDVESDIGKGTSVNICFPVNPSSRQTGADMKNDGKP